MAELKPWNRVSPIDSRIELMLASFLHQLRVFRRMGRSPLEDTMGIMAYSGQGIAHLVLRVFSDRMASLPSGRTG